ncbi:hypothetical protein GTY65_00670 [Streptomyces sp. SID8379]|uniref:hypothetical protein n=1 Tax=unclassified Streptomyces TaxID=2593676 RepID=UPI00037CE6E1|nr:MULTISPECIES: hypothetical protein [unclassified Streptomyces]MYW62598.1 hypothetical protein [Streptomyces sp. SID8379]
MSRQPRSAVNRWFLGTSGLVLLAAGVWLCGAAGRLSGHLPSWWPVPRGALLDRSRLGELRDHAWWTPAVLTLTAVLTTALVLGLLAQLSVRRPSRLALAAPDSHLRGAALADTLRRRTETVDGVARCRVRMARHRGRIHIAQHVRIEPGSSPRAVLRSLSDVITEARNAVAPHTLTVQVRVRSTAHRAPHVH